MGHFSKLCVMKRMSAGFPYFPMEKKGGGTTGATDKRRREVDIRYSVSRVSKYQARAGG